MVRRHSRPTHVSKKLEEKETWGAGLPGSPILAMSDAQEHLTTFAPGVPKPSRASRAPSSVIISLGWSRGATTRLENR
jgi:hypothetical protein